MNGAPPQLLLSSESIYPLFYHIFKTLSRLWPLFTGKHNALTSQIFTPPPHPPQPSGPAILTLPRGVLFIIAAARTAESTITLTLRKWRS